MLQFTEYPKVENKHGDLEKVARSFSIDITEDDLRAEFALFSPEHDVAENPAEFWSKERQFARVKLAEWTRAGHIAGDNVHKQIVDILNK